MSLDASGARTGDKSCQGRDYSYEEQQALRLAAQLRDQVARSRETVRRLRAFVVERDSAGK